MMPAHQVNNPILPRPDRAVEAGRGRNPPVPRAPRAKQRANSMGALSREQKKEGSGYRSANTSLSSLNSGMRTSETRRPAVESPFSHARVNHLQREKTNVDNQVFEMGPKGRVGSVDRHTEKEFSRGHWLGKESEMNQGMPWDKPKEKDESLLPKGRRQLLRNEALEADQALEWVPSICQAQRKGEGDSEIRSHARINVNAREITGAAQSLEMMPMVQVNGMMEAAAAVGQAYHGRRNVLKRESVEESNDAPRASGYCDEGQPVYNRKQMLPPYVPRATAAY